MNSCSSSSLSEGFESIGFDELAPPRVKQAGSSVHSEEEKTSRQFLQKKHLLLRLGFSRTTHLQTIFLQNQHVSSVARLWRCRVFHACCQDMLDVMKSYRLRIFSCRSRESQTFLRVLEKQINMVQMNSVGIFLLMEKISLFMQIKNKQDQKSRLRDDLLPIWNAGLYMVACDAELLTFFLKQESSFFSTQWHPLSEDTVGHYCWRVAFENSDREAIRVLQERNISMPGDIINISLLLDSVTLFKSAGYGSGRFSYESLRPSLVSIT